MPRTGSAAQLCSQAQPGLARTGSGYVSLHNQISLPGDEPIGLCLRALFVLPALASERTPCSLASRVFVLSLNTFFAPSQARRSLVWPEPVQDTCHFTIRSAHRVTNPSDFVCLLPLCLSHLLVKEPRVRWPVGSFYCRSTRFLHLPKLVAAWFGQNRFRIRFISQSEQPTR